MTVNDMVKTFGYIRDRLNHFTISIFDFSTECFATIKHPTADEYVFLCDRPVIEWMVNSEDEDEVDITVAFIPSDFDVFRKYFKD